VYSGLFQVCQSEDQLAAAMAHAFAHQMNLDVEHLEMQPDPGAPLSLVAWQLVSHRFSLLQEQTADRLPFDVFARAGYDPRQGAALFEQLATQFPPAQAPDRTPLLVRAQDARQWAQQVNATRRTLPVADPKTFASLRRQAASLNATQASAETQLFLRAFPNCMLSGDTPDEQSAQAQLRPPPPVRKLEPS
jgi:predicted Zn-dependent protease